MHLLMEQECVHTGVSAQDACILDMSAEVREKLSPFSLASISIYFVRADHLHLLKIKHGSCHVQVAQEMSRKKVLSWWSLMMEIAAGFPSPTFAFFHLATRYIVSVQYD